MEPLNFPILSQSRQQRAREKEERQRVHKGFETLGNSMNRSISIFLTEMK